MTLRTALVINGDSAEAQQALQGVESAMERAEAQAQELAGAYLRTDASIGKLAKSQALAKGEIDAAKASLKSGEITLEEYNRQLLETKTALGLVQAEHRSNVSELKRAQAAYDGAVQAGDRLGQSMNRQRARGRENVVSLGEQRAGMQQLSFQIGDVATMFAMGADPMRIFASQGTQVVQSIGMMRGSAGGLVGFLAGPWGLVITAAATVALSLGSALFSSKGDADAFSEALREMETDADRAAAALGRLRAQQKATLEGDIVLAEIELNKRRDRLSEVELSLAAPAAPVPLGRPSYLTGTTNDNRRELAQEAQDLRWEIVQLQGDIAKGNNALAKKAELEREAASETAATGRATSASAGAIRARTKTISDEERARTQANEQTEQYIASLENEIAKIGLDARGLRQLEAARAAEAAQTDAQRQQIANLNKERERELALEEARQKAGAIAQENEGISGDIAALAREAKAIGLVGWERERLLLMLEHEARIRPLLAQLAKAEAEGLKGNAAQLRQQIELLSQRLDLQIRAGDTGERLDGQAAAAAELAHSYRQLGSAGVGALSDIALRGEDAIDVMKRLALSIADAALHAAFLGQGPLAAIMGTADTGGLVGSLLKTGSGKASGGPVMPGTIYPVNEKSTAPGLFIPLAPGRIEPASNDNGGRGAAASGSGVAYFDLRGAVVTEDLLRQMNEISRRNVQSGLAGYDRVVGDRVRDHLERRG